MIPCLKHVQGVELIRNVGIGGETIRDRAYLTMDKCIDYCRSICNYILKTIPGELINYCQYQNSITNNYHLIHRILACDLCLIYFVYYFPHFEWSLTDVLCIIDDARFKVR